ncbi:MAG TPA: 30S ribosomal protein S7 [Anaerolineaceae bacterium]|nr:30S ribosomal protein S7 [Anaerolineaceae bacterium]
MRRISPEKREVVPDARFQSVIISSFINRIMGCGKKSTATSLVYDAMDIIADKTSKNPMEVLDQAVKNVGPSMEVRPRRVGGATYQVPMDVPPLRRFTLAMRWIIDASRARSGKSFSEKFAGELMDAAANQGTAVRKRDETHKMAEANRAFSHYRM